MIKLGMMVLGMFPGGAMLGGLIGFMIGRKTLRVNWYQPPQTVERLAAAYLGEGVPQN